MSGQASPDPSNASPRALLDLSQLSARELEIVRRLLDGDRVPRIAGSLYLAQSTVRNHLSSVFRKFGVNSQQELIALLRTQPSVEYRCLEIRLLSRHDPQARRSGLRAEP